MELLHLVQVPDQQVIGHRIGLLDVLRRLTDAQPRRA